jgi:hypothetical protein
MSRLIDKFQKAFKSSVQPMGFRAARAAAPEPSLLLIVSVTPDAMKNDDISDAGIILINPEGSQVSVSSIQKLVKNLSDIPVGLYIEDAEEKEVAALAEAGCDFMVFPPSSRIVTPVSSEKKPGFILHVESSMDDSLLRAINSLPVDAVIAADTFEGGSLSWHKLMIFQHMANTMAKPLIINIPADITESEMKALFETGAEGMMVEASTLKDGGLKKLQNMISKLPPRSARKRGKVDATLPRGGGPVSTAPPDEEEEEDE